MDYEQIGAEPRDRVKAELAWLGAIYAENFDRLKYFALSELRKHGVNFSEADQGDFVQEAFVLLVKEIRHGNLSVTDYSLDDEVINGILYRKLRNVIVNYIRKSFAKKRYSGPMVPIENITYLRASVPNPPIPRDLMDYLTEGLVKKTERVIAKEFFADPSASCASISRETDIAESTVRRTLKKLRGRWGKRIRKDLMGANP